MKTIINHIKTSTKKNVLVIGDVMLDEYIFGSVNRISPEAPVPILKEEKREWSLGGAANVALNCKHIGCNIDLIGIINKSDRPGQKFISMLEKNGIPTHGLINSSSRATTCKKRLMANNQQLLRIDTENINFLSVEESNQIEKNLDKLVKQNTIILVSDYAKGIITKQILSKIILLGKQRNCLILVDPKKPNFDKYQNINYIKPNHKEFSEMVNYYGFNQNDSIIENGKKICRQLNLDGLVITLGEKGIQFISNKEIIFIPACKKEVFDLTGAGDTVIAFLALGLSSNLKIKQCLKLANHAAAVAISHLKTYAVSLDELIDKNIDFEEKILHDWAMLKIELDWLKLENKKIVFTNGCFDILHSGHIHLFREAKKQGDILVVGLNTNNSVQRLKGKSRPINNLDERSKILSGIGVIDFIVSFNEDTPKEIIEYLSPDILVKGGDYKKESIVGYDFVKSNGGHIHIVNYQADLATTNIVNKIKQINY